MICSNSCSRCDNRIDVIVPPKHWFDFPWKVPGCKLITDKLYEQKWVWTSLQEAIMDLFMEYDNRGFIIQDQIIRHNSGELFPEIINTDGYVIYLPVEG